jgi:hypothetical protein
VPAPNRVTPTGEIVAIDQRGLFMGNRGCIHRRPGEIARPWQVRRWITCVLEFKGWVAPKWEPGRWTPLFFWDEAVALAAGHRPCALCRRADYNRWLDAWEAASGERPRADPLDRRLHEDRRDGRAQRRHTRPWRDLPTGTFVALDRTGAAPTAATRTSTGTFVAPDRAEAAPTAATRTSTGTFVAQDRAEAVPAVVVGDRLVPWSAAGYGEPVERPQRGAATVLTPRATVEVLRRGYGPVIHPSAGETG